MNSKRKGTRNEHRSIAILESQGYRCTRAAASLGTFDIIAVGVDDVLLVQVKSNRNPSGAELEAIRKFKAPPNCRKVVHRWNDRRAEPDVREL